MPEHLLVGAALARAELDVLDWVGCVTTSAGLRGPDDRGDDDRGWIDVNDATEPYWLTTGSRPVSELTVPDSPFRRATRNPNRSPVPTCAGRQPCGRMTRGHSRCGPARRVRGFRRRAGAGQSPSPRHLRSGDAHRWGEVSGSILPSSGQRCRAAERIGARADGKPGPLAVAQKGYCAPRANSPVAELCCARRRPPRVALASPGR